MQWSFEPSVQSYCIYYIVDYLFDWWNPIPCVWLLHQVVDETCMMTSKRYLNTTLYNWWSGYARYLVPTFAKGIRESVTRTLRLTFCNWSWSPVQSVSIKAWGWCGMNRLRPAKGKPTLLHWYKELHFTNQMSYFQNACMRLDAKGNEK